MLANWVRETTTTTGTGALALTAVTGYPRFSACFPVMSASTDGSPFYYAILDDATLLPLEIGLGTLTNSGNTLNRVKVLATLVNGTLDDTQPSAASLPAGTKRVVCADAASARLLAPQRQGQLGSAYMDAFSAHFVSRGEPNHGTTGPQSANWFQFEVYQHTGSGAVTHFGTQVTTAQAGAACRMGIYTMKKDSNYPVGVLLHESAEMDCSTTGLKVAQRIDSVASFSLAPGWYWLARLNKTANVEYKAYKGGWLFAGDWVHGFGVPAIVYRTTTYGVNLPADLTGASQSQGTPGDTAATGFLRLAD